MSNLLDSERAEASLLAPLVAPPDSRLCLGWHPGHSVGVGGKRARVAPDGTVHHGYRCVLDLGGG